MITILRNEVRRFYGSLTGSLAMVVFLVVMGLFVWVFPETSVLNGGFANLDVFFGLAPYVLIFLVPAVTMRSLAEEYGAGTIEVLATRPVSNGAILWGKYLGALVLVFATLLLSLVYLASVWWLALPTGAIDGGGLVGSYIGLFLLAAAFTAIGLFSSSITSNAIVAFLVGVFLCFFAFIAFDYLAKLGAFFGRIDYLIERIGMEAHYRSISRGVIDTRDVVYFGTVIAGFLLATSISLTQRTR